MSAVKHFTYHDVVAALSRERHEWHSTPQIAESMGWEWRPGSRALRPLRETLYALLVAGTVEQLPGRGGRPHQWRLIP